MQQPIELEVSISIQPPDQKRVYASFPREEKGLREE